MREKVKPRVYKSGSLWIAELWVAQRGNIAIGFYRWRDAVRFATTGKVETAWACPV